MDQYWLEVAIDTTPECLDDVAAYLTGCGIVGLSLENEADLNEFMAENKAYWDEVDDALKAAWKGVSRVKFYVTEDEDGKARLAEVEAGLEAFRQRVGKDAGTLAISTTSLREEDWSENWKQYYQPFPVGEKLYVVPEWMRGEPRPHLRHRQPRHHPPLPGRGGALCETWGSGVGSGYRQRYLSHRRRALGRKGSRGL